MHTRLDALASLLVLGLACMPVDPPATPDASSPISPWLDELPVGAHAVGHRLVWIEDPTRALADPIAGSSSKRPLLLAVWYPAQPGSGSAMQLDDYVRVPAPAPEPWRARLEGHLGRVRTHEALGGRESDVLAGRATAARRDASWATGHFPLVLAHPGLGGSLTDNFALWEQLAAHGFVVVSGAFLDASGLSSAIAWDPSTSIADLDRMFETAASWPGVDAERTLVIGHSYGAQAAIAYALAGRDVDGVISLDSTLEYADPAAPWYASGEPAQWLGARERLRVPILVAHGGGTTGYVEGLVHADRWIASFPSLTHDDFIAHGGVLRAELEGRDAVRRSHGALAGAILHFARALTDDSPVKAEALGPEFRHLPATQEPDIALVLAWLRELGPAAAWERCATQVGCEAEYLFNDAGYALQRAGHDDEAEALFGMIVERVPDSWNAWDSWAEAAARRGRRADALHRYRAALERLDADASAEQGPRIRARIDELEQP